MSPMRVLLLQYYMAAIKLSSSLSIVASIKSSMVGTIPRGYIDAFIAGETLAVTLFFHEWLLGDTKTNDMYCVGTILLCDI